MAIDETPPRPSTPRPRPTPAPEPTQIEQPHDVHEETITPAPEPGPSRGAKRKQQQDTGPRKKVKTWYETTDKTIENGITTLHIRAEKIPGQQRITATMSDVEKVDVAIYNQRLRDTEVSKAEQTLENTKIQLTGKFLNLGIVENGRFNILNEDHVRAIMNTGVPKTTTTTTEPTTIDSNKEDTTTRKGTTKFIVTKDPNEIGKPTTTVTETPTETVPTEEVHHVWLMVSYAGYHFRVILYDSDAIGTQGDWIAEHKIKVHRIPGFEEDIQIYASNETKLWWEITHKLHDLTEEEQKQIYTAIRDTYIADRHGLLSVDE